MFALTGISQAIDGQAQIRQDIIIDNVVKKNSVRVEAFLRQDDTVIIGFVVANGGALCSELP
ncbi:MAG: hypothetical protein IIA07_05435 [Proteobacteria bacterium]|nr:hypothetical protein [Pseudomonadota bacterium]